MTSFSYKHGKKTTYMIIGEGRGSYANIYQRIT